jgi:hypothetical protein
MNPTHRSLSSNSLLTITQFIAHYDPTHYPLSSNSLLTIIQSLDTVPTPIPVTESILKYATKYKNKREVFLTPCPYTAAAHEGFATSSYSTCRAQCISMYSFVQVWLPCRGAHVRYLDTQTVKVSFMASAASKLKGKESRFSLRRFVKLWEPWSCIRNVQFGLMDILRGRTCVLVVKPSNKYTLVQGCLTLTASPTLL